ncbi:hypothetical protein ACL2XG_17385 [Sodalis sp. RH24]|uniref:hypothetical protein n=1 Tax=unclassified Sodalis (in: enterobacteria) TaxID=2636512 RepID=UPI0039B487EB
MEKVNGNIPTDNGVIAFTPPPADSMVAHNTILAGRLRNAGNAPGCTALNQCHHPMGHYPMPTAIYLPVYPVYMGCYTPGYVYPPRAMVHNQINLSVCTSPEIAAYPQESRQQAVGKERLPVFPSRFQGTYRGPLRNKKDIAKPSMPNPVDSAIDTGSLNENKKFILK